MTAAEFKAEVLARLAPELAPDAVDELAKCPWWDAPPPEFINSLLTTIDGPWGSRFRAPGFRPPADETTLDRAASVLPVKPSARQRLISDHAANLALLRVGLVAQRLTEVILAKNNRHLVERIATVQGECPVLGRFLDDRFPDLPASRRQALARAIPDARGRSERSLVAAVERELASSRH